MNKNLFKIKQALGMVSNDVTDTTDVTTETKGANDVMHSHNTGFGEELINPIGFSNKIIEETQKASTFLSMLPGFHGYGLPENLVVPVIGEVGYMQNATEWTNPTDRTHTGSALPTAQVKLKKEKLKAVVHISDEMLERTNFDLQGYIMTSIGHSFSRTAESILLNADDTTGTNNINAKGENVQSGDKRHWFRPAGVRKTAIDQGNIKDLGVIDESDLFDMVALLGDKAAQPADCVWVMNRATALKVSQIPSLKNHYQNGRSSTIVKGAETNVLASDIFITREIANATDDGKVSKTASENTKGQIVYMHKSAPQFGYDNLRIEVIRVGGHGYEIIATTYFGHAIASGLLDSDKSVALGVNVTL